MKALRTITNYAAGSLGKSVWSSSSSSSLIYGIAALPAACPPGAMWARSFPCVSAPFSSLTRRDECALSVHAGCGGEVAPWSNVGCEMRGNSHVRFALHGSGRCSPDCSPDPRLDGQWIVGPNRSAADAGESFWVYRADGKPHGLKASDLVALSEGIGGVGYVRCLLSVVDTRYDALGRQPSAGLESGHVLPAEEARSNSTYSYEACPTSDASGADRDAVMPTPSQPSLWSTPWGLGLTCAGLLMGGALLLLLCRRFGRPKLPRQDPLLSRPAQRDAASQVEEVGTSCNDPSVQALVSPLEISVSQSTKHVTFDLTAERQLGRQLPIEETPAAPLPSWDVMYVED